MKLFHLEGDHRLGDAVSQLKLLFDSIQLLAGAQVIVDVVCNFFPTAESLVLGETSLVIGRLCCAGDKDIHDCVPSLAHLSELSCDDISLVERAAQEGSRWEYGTIPQ